MERPDSNHISIPPRKPILKVQFSLFEGDLVNQVFGSIRPRRPLQWLYRSLILIGLTWLPLAILSVVSGNYGMTVSPTNFFADYAAYAQFIIALPIFVIAEAVVEHNTRLAGRHFVHTGVIRERDITKIEAIHEYARYLRKALLPEFILIATAYLLAFLTFYPEFSDFKRQTWHTMTLYKFKVLTLPGIWAMFVALPILNYWWLRMSWKIIIWIWYLYRVSRLRMILIASHPDRTGGIGFISDTQAKFALVILAYGISNVAAVIAYKIGIEGADFHQMNVWGPALGFVIGAPALFTLPLFMFTKQLNRTKKRAMNLYREKAMQRARDFEKQWLHSGSREKDQVNVFDLADLNSFTEVFERIRGMRIVPFDLRSASQIIGSTLGSIATVLPLLKIETSLAHWLKILATILSRTS